MRKAKNVCNRRLPWERNLDASSPRALNHEIGKGSELERSRVLLHKLMGRCEQLAHEVDKAYSGQLFLPGKEPSAPENIRRFYRCFSEHSAISNLLFRTIRLLRMSYEVESADTAAFLIFLEGLRKDSARIPGRGGQTRKQHARRTSGKKEFLRNEATKSFNVNNRKYRKFNER